MAAGLLAIGSCATQKHQAAHPEPGGSSAAPLLNSERIRRQFGSYGIDVLSENEHLRVSNLYSVEKGIKIMRTLAVVMYPQIIPASVLAEHAEITKGQSIGEVFKRHGWHVEKQNIYIGEMPVSPGFSGVYALMGGIGETGLAVHIYRLLVSKSGIRCEYALIAEIHHPEFLDAKRLRDIYTETAASSGGGRRYIDSTLEIVNEVMKNQKPPR